ncbi:MAG: serine hydrolase [Bryobacteraceae bacterium]
MRITSFESCTAIAAVLLWPAALPGQRKGLGEWPKAPPHEVGLNESKLDVARDYALTGGGSGMIIRYGKLVYAWGNPDALYDLKSTTKSIGVTALGLALADGKVRLEDPVATHHPTFANDLEGKRTSGWLDDVTLLHLASQTAGFDKPGGYTDLLFEPGTKWSYSDGGPNWLAECLTLVYKKDIAELMFERVFDPLGIGREDLTWRDNAYRPKLIDGIPRREFGSGIHANVDAMARIGFLYLRAGRINERPIIPSSFVHLVRLPMKRFRGLRVLKEDLYPDASNHYGLLWWNNADGSVEGVPRDAYWSWGLYDSHIIVIPSLDLVIARAGKSLRETRGADPSLVQRLVGPIVEAVDPSTVLRPPYPSSPVIESITWSDRSSIRRAGAECDLWPTAWAANDDLLTAYGDCWGVEPRRPHKLGMGFARIEGEPGAFTVSNILSDTGENTGQGAAGKKASGLLYLDGVLYMWARNAANSQLAWSEDEGKTWTWSDWKFTTSFGYPVFLQFGRNYAGARDQYVYVYSPDTGSAYVPWGKMVLARVPKDRIRNRSAYEFFKSSDGEGEPLWTADIEQRGAVVTNPQGLGYRTQVSYNSGLKRYFMNQILYGEVNTRFQGGFVILDAPEPWGPWTTAYFTPNWDVAPGENQHFPPKWMSTDGTTMHLIFSGDDMLSVRKATVHLRKRN